jgi:hypothetical protein
MLKTRQNQQSGSQTIFFFLKNKNNRKSISKNRISREKGRYKILFVSQMYGRSKE